MNQSILICVCHSKALFYMVHPISNVQTKLFNKTILWISYNEIVYYFTYFFEFSWKFEIQIMTNTNSVNPVLPLSL